MEHDDQPNLREQWLAAQRAAHAASQMRRNRERRASESRPPPPTGPPPWSLEAVIADDKGLTVLRDFCATELSEENVNFLVEARAWRAAWNTTSNDERRNGADSLVLRYLTPDAEFEVSLPAGVEADFAEDKPLAAAMFDRAMAAARKTLFQDVFPR